MEQYQSHLAETGAPDPNRSLLMAAAKTMVLAGNKEFSIADLCGQAGVERGIFHDHFAGKTALIAALMREARMGAASSAPVQPVATVQPIAPIASKADDITLVPSVSTQDEWFERRLRVFER